MIKLIRISSIIIVVAVICLTGFRKSETAFVKSAAAPAGHTGSPGDGESCIKCHKDYKATNLDGIITSNIPNEGYEPGKEYTIVANFKRMGHIELGFQISPQNEAGDKIGVLSSISSETKLVGDNLGYITHTKTGISTSNGEKKWTFNWTAPAKNSGDFTFYGAFNASNNNNKSTGDSIFLSSLKVKENLTIGIKENNENQFSFQAFPNPFTDALNIKYTLAQSKPVSISVYNYQGKLIDELSNKVELPGAYSKTFNFLDSKYTVGLYFVYLSIGDKLMVKQLVKKN